MSPVWLAALVAGVLVIVLSAVLVIFIRRTHKRLDRELGLLRKELLVQLSANHREHARALLKSAAELFVDGHVATAAMLEMHATDFEIRAADAERRAGKDLTAEPEQDASSAADSRSESRAR